MDMSKTGKSMAAVNFVSKLFWQCVHQMDSGGICRLPALAYHYDTVLSSRITVPSVPRMSNPKGQELDSNSKGTKDF